jgi:general secretion pathway protein M
MKTWFEGRTRREQVLLAIMGGGLLVFILWFGVWRPVDHARASAERRYERAARDAAVAARAVAAVRALPAAGAARSGLPVADAVNAAAQSAGLTLARAEADPAGGLQVAVQGVAPARVFPWLATLQTEYGIAPRHLTVIKDEQGTLSVDATFGGAE